MKKVLIIDDTKNIRLMLSKCLELEGYSVDMAIDGKQGLEMLLNKTYDLAFLDIKLPEIRGTEVLRRVKSQGIKTPIIVITAYATVSNAVECTNLGAVAYVQKPFSSEKIKNVLHSLMSENPSDISSLLLNSIEALENRNVDTAIEFLKKAISIEPDNSEIYKLFADAYNLNGDSKNENKFRAIYKALTEN